MFEKLISFVYLLAFFFSCPLYSIETITVRADRIKSSLDKSPSDIKIFNENEIKQTESISDLLSRESDLKISSSGPTGSNASLFLRGSDSSHILVIIDGIIMNDPSNPNRQFDFARLSLNNVERIEVLKGSQGLLYGSNAIGGVILITTKKAKGSLTGAASVSYGSFDTFKASLNSQKKINSTAISLGIDHLKSRGFSAANSKKNLNADDDGEKRTSLDANVSQAMNNSSELILNYRYVNDIADIDKGGGVNNDDPDDAQLTKEQYLKIGFNKEWNKSETAFAFTQSSHHRTLKTSTTSTTKGVLQNFSINHTEYINNNLTQNINADYSHEKDQFKNFNENISLFLYNRLEMDSNIINLGIRADHNKYFKEHITYKLAYLKNIHEMIFKTSYSTGFRAPSLNQLFDPTYGNKNLTPEKSQSAELGLEIPFLNTQKFLTTLFYTNIYNRFSYVPVTFVNQNQGRARIIGIENSLESQLTNDISADVSLTWLSARDLSANKKLARRPNLNSKFGISYILERQRFNLEGDFTGERLDVDNQGNDVTLPSYLIFNFNYDIHLRNNFSSYFKLKNILNKEYEEIFGYGTGGRNFSLGFKYLF